MKLRLKTSGPFRSVLATLKDCGSTGFKANSPYISFHSKSGPGTFLLHAKHCAAIHFPKFMPLWLSIESDGRSLSLSQTTVFEITSHLINVGDVGDWTRYLLH